MKKCITVLMLLVMVALLLAPAALADNVPEPEALFSPELVGKEPGSFEGQPAMVGANPTEHNVMLGVSAEDHNVMLTSAPGYTANTDGSFSAVITGYGLTWLRADVDCTCHWFALDNSDGVFEPGSIFTIKLIGKGTDSEEWFRLHGMLDEHYQTELGDDVSFFRFSVTDPDGTEMTITDQKFRLYVQASSAWVEDLLPVFVSTGEDEMIEHLYTILTSPTGERMPCVELSLPHTGSIVVGEKLPFPASVFSDGSSVWQIAALCEAGVIVILALWLILRGKKRRA